MGEHPDLVYYTGCPSVDVAKEAVENNTKTPNELISKYGGVGNLDDEFSNYIIVMQHPVTTELISARKQINETYNALQNYKGQIFWFWPNVDAGSDDTSKALRIIRENENPENIYFIRNLSPEDFIVFLSKAECIIGNSSVAIREASFLGVPAINIGTRQTGRERGKNVLDTNYSAKEITDSLREILEYNALVRESDTLYGDGFAGQKIANIIAETEIPFTKKLQY
jgi:UDP-hydrolysing UDP-N-acetyl-D-glucosamine 2-epimerase